MEDREFPFEFERKFFVNKLPKEVALHGSKQIIIQSYVFAEDGYSVRIRVTFQGVEWTPPKFDERRDFVGGYERRVLAELIEKAEEIEQLRREQRGLFADVEGVDFGDASVPVASATVAVKSPPVKAERYELEHELDIDVAVQILQRSARMVLKTRYSMWYEEDGWEFDVFHGKNSGLIVAECERLTPVVNLKIPDFAVTEVTGDPRFMNDSLSKEPWHGWEHQFRTELDGRGPYFMDME